MWNLLIAITECALMHVCFIGLYIGHAIERAEKQIRGDYLFEVFALTSLVLSFVNIGYVILNFNWG